MRGIDISSYQGHPDWRQVHESGVERVMMKFSEYHIDKVVLENLAALEAYRPDATKVPIDGIRTGLYHLWHGELSRSQADGMLAEYLQPRELQLERPAIDLETDSDDPDVHFVKRATPAELEGLIWIVEKVCDQEGQCLIYLSERGAKALRLAGFWDRLWKIPGTMLWLCDHGNEPVDLDGAPKWTWWQHSSKGAVPGIDGHVDLDEVR
jgi:lysozyme